MLAAAALLAPSATVTLTPATQQVTLDVPIVVDPGIKKPNVAQGRLPGRVINKEITETAEAPATMPPIWAISRGPSSLM